MDVDHGSPSWSETMSMDGFAKGAGECSVTGADKDNFISDLDINLQVDDVVIGINEVLPEIRFLERVHKPLMRSYQSR
ncbi:hypothetical protein V6N13_106760 [Hibiscus sabdariffa]